VVAVIAFSRERLSPWAGTFLGAAGWFLHHQGGSNANYWDCQRGGLLWTLVLGLVASVVVAAGGAISWRIWRNPAGEDAAEVRSFGAIVSVAAAGLFLFAISLQTLAAFIVPRCGP
jgi:hypothetical protein